MLVLTRKQDEVIRIGERILVTVVRTRQGSVRIGIDAPPEMEILRGELDDFLMPSRECGETGRDHRQPGSAGIVACHDPRIE
jgi:carbon storage regulator CsrA